MTEGHDGEVVGATLAVARRKLTKKFPIFQGIFICIGWRGRTPRRLYARKRRQGRPRFTAIWVFLFLLFPFYRFFSCCNHHHTNFHSTPPKLSKIRTFIRYFPFV